jgi:hypothetical protein
MNPETLRSLLKIIDISHEMRVGFHEKLDLILRQVLETMKTAKGSIMLVRRTGRSRSWPRATPGSWA